MIKGVYFPSDSDLKPLSNSKLRAIRESIHLLSDSRLPWPIFDSLSELEIYEDPGMNDDNGVNGFTSQYNKNKVLLSPGMVRDIDSKDSNGILNNEFSMSIFVHELTHLDQMRWLGGIPFIIFNIPGIELFTCEKWALQNETYTRNWLSDRYDIMRTKLET